MSSGVPRVQVRNDDGIGAAGPAMNSIRLDSFNSRYSGCGFARASMSDREDAKSSSLLLCYRLYRC